jgi:hypothetical protein
VSSQRIDGALTVIVSQTGIFYLALTRSGLAQPLQLSYFTVAAVSDSVLVIISVCGSIPAEVRHSRRP